MIKIVQKKNTCLKNIHNFTRTQNSIRRPCANLIPDSCSSKLLNFQRGDDIIFLSCPFGLVKLHQELSFSWRMRSPPKKKSTEQTVVASNVRYKEKIGLDITFPMTMIFCEFFSTTISTWMKSFAFGLVL